MKNLILIIFLTVAVFAQVEKVEQIEKEITPTEIAGQEAVKCIVTDIIFDSEGTEIWVTDVVRLEDTTEVIYYRDIAFTEADAPFTLSEEEKESL